MTRRIVILAKFFPPVQGGMEVYVHALANALKTDFDVHVLAHSINRINSEEMWGGFRVMRCATIINALSQPFSPSMVSELKRLSPDIVHLNAPNAFATLCWYLAARKSHLVITHHGDVLGRRAAKIIYLPLYRSAVMAAHKIIVFSRKNVHNSLDLPPFEHKLVEIPQGLDPRDFEADEDLRTEAVELRRSLAGDAPVAAFVGRLIPYKGLDVLIRAIAKLPTAHALVAGQGPLRTQLEAVAAQSGVTDRFHLLGEINERTKKTVYLAADLFVLPSISTAEAFGIAQVEAQMMGLPIVASDLPSGVTDVTINGRTGFLVPPGNALALAAAMACLFADKELAIRMGEAGRQRALENFSLATFNCANRKVFGEIV